MSIEFNDQQVYALYDIENWWHSKDKQIYELSGSAGTGKAQPIDTTIPTPDGVRKLSDLKVGDYVYDRYLNPSEILGVYDQGEMDVYKITFEDGRSTLCNDQHLWTYYVNDSIFPVTKILRSLLNITLMNDDGTYRYNIPLCMRDMNDNTKVYKKLDRLGVAKVEDMHYKTEMRCIYVNNPEHLYLTNDYIVTHNTTLVKYFIERIGLDLSQVAFVSFCGKGAVQMARNGLPAQTIHSLIYEYEKILDLDKDGKIQLDAKGKPKTKNVFVKRDKLSKKIKLIVLDEASMVNEEIGKDLLSYDIPLIALGDLNQLPPVFGSSYFLREPDYVLTKVMRQSENDPIVWLAHQVLDNKPLTMGVYGKSSVISKSDLNPFLLNKADIVLTCTNNLRSNINTLFREEIKNIKKLDLPNVGEKVICRKNNWSRSINDSIYLTNGMSGTVDYVDVSSFNGKDIKIDFKPDFLNKKFKNLKIDYKRLFEKPSEHKDMFSFTRDQFEFAYAITTHSCLTLDTLIYTEDGIIPIGELKNYKGKIYNGTFWETPKFYIDNSFDNVNKFTMDNGTEYNVTDLHKCKVYNDDGTVSTIYGRDIKIGDALLLRNGQCLYDTSKPYKFDNNFISEMTDDIAKLLGIISANVCQCVVDTGDDDKTIITISDSSGKHTDSVVHLLKNILGDKYTDIVEYNNNVCTITPTDFYSVLTSFGSIKKGDVCEYIMRSTLQHQKMFIEGLCTSGNTISVLTTYKNKFACMLLNIGYEFHFSPTESPEITELFINRDNKNDNDLFIITKVKSISRYVKQTACFEMPITHAFIQDGFYGGNSQGSQYPDVLFLNEKMCFDKDTYKKLQYTAITRASKSITIVI